MALSKQKSLKAILIEGVMRHRVIFSVMIAYWGSCFSLGLYYDRQINPFLYAPVFVLLFVLIGLFHVARSAADLVRRPDAILASMLSMRT